MDCTVIIILDGTVNRGSKCRMMGGFVFGRAGHCRSSIESSSSSSDDDDDDDTTRLKDDAYLLLHALLLVTNDLFNERYDKEDDGAS